MIIYEDQSETDELGAMNLTSVRVDYKKDLEFMLEVMGSSTLPSCNTDYILFSSVPTRLRSIPLTMSIYYKRLITTK